MFWAIALAMLHSHRLGSGAIVGESPAACRRGVLRLVSYGTCDMTCDMMISVALLAVIVVLPSRKW